VRYGYEPKNAVLEPEEVDGEQGWRSVPVSTPVEAAPGLIVYRFNHSLYYANTEKFSEEILALINTSDPPVSWLCVDAAAIDEVDWSGGATLRQVYGQLKERGIRLVFAEVSADVRAELDRYEVTKLVGENAFYRSVAAMMAAYGQEQSHAGTDPAT